MFDEKGVWSGFAVLCHPFKALQHGRTGAFHLLDGVDCGGEVARMATGTGGGYGDPMSRPVEEIERDVHGEYITPEQAERDYGVIIDPRTGRGERRRSALAARSSFAPVTSARETPYESKAGGSIRQSDKVDAILGVIRGETSSSAVALRFGVDRATVDAWIGQFIQAGEGAVNTSAGGGSNEVSELRAMLRQLSEEVSTLRRSIKP